MIYITGDTHIPVDIQKLNSKRFPEQKVLTADDYLIICGDFGGVWDDGNEEKYWRRWLDQKRFTTLFVDGNHENFDLLYGFPETEFCGGLVHRISDKVYHLMRGQIFDIDGKRIFTFGGASSHDRQHRKEGVSWWENELPSELETERAIANLDGVDWCVDAVITHCAPDSIQSLLCDGYESNVLTAFLEEIKGRLSYKKWFFGHYHIDKAIDGKHRALFDEITAFEG